MFKFPNIDKQKYILNALAALASDYEPTREAIILKLKDFDLDIVLKSESAINLLLSLSRTCKILKQVLCDEPRIVNYLLSSYTNLHI